MNIDLLAPSTRELFRSAYERPTHKLVIHLIPLPWADWNKLRDAFSAIINAVNPILERFGWKALYCAIEGDNLVIYLRKLGSILPIAAILAAIAAIIWGIGFLIDRIMLVQIETQEVQIKKERQELTEEITNTWLSGEISTDEYVQVMSVLGAKEEAEENIRQQSAIQQILSLLSSILPLILIGAIIYLVYRFIQFIRR